MAKAKIPGRKNTSVNLTEDQIAWIRSQGLEISSLLRELLDECIEKSMSSDELLRKKRKELLEEQKKLLEEIAVIDTQLGKREEKRSFVEKVIKEESELETQRKEYIISCEKNMQTRDLNLNMWLDHVKAAYRFEDRTAAKEYILKTWVEDGADELKVRKFLGLT